MILDDYEEELIKSTVKNSESVFQRVADSYEDDLLELDEFPCEYLDFVAKVLSESSLYNKAGAWNFLLVLSTESHRLESKHYQKLSDCIIANYQYYENEDLCLAVCDFIARNYEISKASSVFDTLNDIENKKAISLRGFVEDGRRILEAEEKRRN